MVPRPRCSRCRRAAVTCYCAKLTELPTRTSVVILQHPRERDKAIGTARMASLCLPQSQLHVGVRWEDHVALRAALSDATRPAGLLFPDATARDILRERPPGPITLVVIDGTWSQAKNVVRDNPILQALPRYGFAPPEPSQYRIRKEPNAEFVSTLEALMYVLGVLEDKPEAFRAMLEPFRAMIDMQIMCQAQRPQRRYRQPRGGPPRQPTLPDALTSRYDDLVCVVGEANAWPYHSGRDVPDELVHWIAHRPSTGETFEQIAAPELELSPSTTFHTQLTEQELQAAASREQLVTKFAAFTRDSDVVAAWGTYGPDRFLEAGGRLGERLDLRAVAQRLANKRIGALDELAAGLGPARAPLGRGRAGSRLAAIVQLVEHWRATVGNSMM